MNLFGGLMPELASEHGARLDHVNDLVHLLMFVMFILWTALFIYMLFRFRAGRQKKAEYDGIKTKASTWAEVGVIVSEVILLIGFSIPLYSERVAELPPEDQAVHVRVVGEQFAWNVHYPGPDGQFGRTAADLVDVETNPLGLDSDDPASADDVSTINQLYLPVNKPVLIQLSTKDVIHSFYLPEMRVKQDAIPGVSFPVWFEPTVTTAEMRERKGDETFSYEIGCAQLCGLGHYRMRGFMTIQTQEEFDAWMAEQQELLQSQEGGDDFWG